MKSLSQIIPGMFVILFFATSCQRNSLENTFALEQDKVSAKAGQPVVLAKNAQSPEVCNPNAYTIILESHTLVNGYWEWVWSVQNPNPGNGKNGTSQDLSLWGMQLGSCVNWGSVISAAYSNNGLTWNNFTPSYQSDPSQECLTTPVLKFDFGTSGTAKTYYRLVVNQHYTAGTVQGYYKSGAHTGCCTFNFTGISECGGPVEVEIVE
ncbi:MAG: hypothetical protein ACXWWC_15115 [Chitinophagaceae bacterium]